MDPVWGGRGLANIAAGAKYHDVWSGDIGNDWVSNQRHTMDDGNRHGRSDREGKESDIQYRNWAYHVGFDVAGLDVANTRVYGMSMMKRLLAVGLMTLMSFVGVSLLSPVQVSALTEDDCQRPFLVTFRPWYHGLVEVQDTTNPQTGVIEQRCVVRSPQGEDELTMFVWVIILNILGILLSLVGYLALGVLIYGGYLFVLARGDPSKISGSKRTITAAIVGLIICILASLIANTIVNIMTGALGA